MQRAARHTAGPPLPFLINKKEFSIMEQTICVNAPLALAGTRNTRELGGYPAACGRKTRRHAFLRSDGLSGLTDKDVQMLLDYGVCCVVDLRSESETAAAPSRLADVPGVDYYSIPMLDEAASQGFTGGMPERMGDVYVKLLSGGTTVILVSHSIDQIERMCNKVAWLDHGHLRRIGATKEITAEYRRFEKKDAMPAKVTEE